ncbi:MAG: hypothetical protein GXP47_08175 [Acidobacteria bacterium]|nr:hypothetical protein [Acidobacteriota bacterium]
MDADARRPWLVLAFLVFVVLAFILGHRYREAGRPVLVEVRVVTATASDPVFRDGRRHLAPGETFQLAVAIRLQQRGKGTYWISPAPELALRGTETDHVVTSSWPEDDRILRVHWSTIECSFLGGELTADNVAQRLTYRAFLAPELGREPLVQGDMEAHNDDFLGELPPPPDPPPGTLRFKARVEVVANDEDIRPIQALSSPGAEALGGPRLAVISRDLAAPKGIDPSVGQLFLLPGFEVAPGNISAGEALVQTTGHDMAGLAERRIAVSSWTFAATAVSGSASLDPLSLKKLGTLSITARGLLSGGHSLRWGTKVRPGDLLEIDQHWIVLDADDGNGVLDLSDRVLHCWRRPPQSVRLIDALDIGARSAKLYRHGGS